MNEKSEKTCIDAVKEKYLKYNYIPIKAHFFTDEILFNRDIHYQYLRKMMSSLRKAINTEHFVASWYKSMDSGQPWFLFWITTTLDIIQPEKGISESEKKKMIDYLKACQHPDGGFCGAPLMEAHVASTYAAICTIVNLNCKEAFDIVDRPKMLDYLLRLKHNSDTVIAPPSECSQTRTTKPGSFEIHINGENDMRSTYCSLVIADVLNLLGHPKLREGVGEWISKCQSYEGGISCVPYGEAHSGYTYCGLAALILINETDKIDVLKLQEWAVNRQLIAEGGFNGRTNKFVDSCYNFWQSGTLELVDIALKGKANYKGEWLFNQQSIQGYALMCCQSEKGGMVDKPTKSADLYHTCYSLAGLSIAQSKSMYQKLYVDKDFTDKNAVDSSVMLSKNYSNRVSRVHPLYNVQHHKLEAAKNYYASLSQ